MTMRCPFLSSFLVSSGSSATGLDASRPFSLPLPSRHLTFPLNGPRPPPFFPIFPLHAPVPLKKTTADSRRSLLP
jgi:hypothetical protein